MNALTWYALGTLAFLLLWALAGALGAFRFPPPPTTPCKRCGADAPPTQPLCFACADDVAQGRTQGRTDERTERQREAIERTERGEVP